LRGGRGLRVGQRSREGGEEKENREAMCHGKVPSEAR
jgi:hypothetical protein